MKKKNLYQLANVSFGKINDENCFMYKLSTGVYTKIGSIKKYNTNTDGIVEYKSLSKIIDENKLDYILMTENGKRNLITSHDTEYVKYFCSLRKKITKKDLFDEQSLKLSNSIVRNAFNKYSPSSIKATTKQRIAKDLSLYISLRSLEDKEFYIFKNENKFEDGFYNILIRNKIKNLTELSDFCVTITHNSSGLNLKPTKSEKVLLLQQEVA